ncbi:MAG: c-type cytochrome biogenesis protein CcmI [Cellvibrionaceae bacterium]
MMDFGWLFALLALLAALFVVWPLLVVKHKQSGGTGDDHSEVAERKAFNDALYVEQLQELEQLLTNGKVSQQQYDKLKKELESQHTQDNDINPLASPKRRLRHAPWIVAGLGLAVPLIAFLLYNSMGAVDDWEIQQLNTSIVRQQARGVEREDLRPLHEKLYSKLEARLEAQPDNLNNRFLLARTAVELGRLRDALAGYQYILERQPNSPQVLGEMAQVLFMAAGNRFTPEVRQVFDRALALDPGNSELLGFAGIGAYQSGQFQLAIDYWERGMQILDPNDRRYQTWQRAIAQAKQQLGDSVAENESASTQEEPADATTSLQVTVTLGEEVEANPADRVFVYARAWEGAKMPLAMQETKVANLPLTVELDESMSMVPGMTMSRFPQLEIVARISSSGVADAQSGDWQGTAGPIESGVAQQPLNLVIDSQIP